MTYTVANLETAMCLWEALLEERENGKLAAHADAFIEDEGTSAARYYVGQWVEECEAEWEADREKGTENVPYDWEHCPRFVARKLRERFPHLAESDTAATGARADLADQIKTLWDGINALEDCNTDMQAERRDTYGPDRDDLCTAMALVTEGLGLPTGADAEFLIAA